MCQREVRPIIINWTIRQVRERWRQRWLEKTERWGIGSSSVLESDDFRNSLSGLHANENRSGSSDKFQMFHNYVPPVSRVSSEPLPTSTRITSSWADDVKPWPYKEGVLSNWTLPWNMKAFQNSERKVNGCRNEALMFCYSCLHSPDSSSWLSYR